MTFKYRYRKQIIAVSILCTCIIIFSYIIYNYNQENKKEKKENTSLLEEKKPVKVEKEIEEIMVDVKGQVNAPGIYKLTTKDRIIDAINMAGGVLNTADTSVLNLSKKLVDEMVIIVYSKNQVKDFEKVKEVEKRVEDACKAGSNGIGNNACIESDTTKMVTSGKISINQATKEELMTLTGIGEAKADKIIAYREENNGFNAIEEIKNVEGIGDNLFDKIKEDITL